MAIDQTNQLAIDHLDDHRKELEEMFAEVLGNDNVYFSPPESVRMNYECIVYERVSGLTHFADNKPYRVSERYIATIISKDPDTKTPYKLASQEKCTFDRSYSSDGLYHFVFTVY